MFDGSLGSCKTKPVDIELQPEEKPYHAKPYPVTRAHKAVSCKEVERLFQVRVLKKVNRSEWRASTFIQPKNDGTVRLLSNLTKKIKESAEKKNSNP